MTYNKARPSQSNADMFKGGQAPAEVNRSTGSQHLMVVKNKLEQFKPSFEAVLPRGYSVDRFISTAGFYVKNNPSLWECPVPSLLREFVKVAQQGLDLSTLNECHIVAYGREPVMIRGYKGDLKMARRSPTVKFIDAYAVYSNDTCEFVMGDTPKVTHKPPKFGDDRGEVLGFYAVARDHNDGVYLLMMSNAELLKHAKRFPPKAKKGPFGYIEEKGPSHPNWEAYGLKTVLIHLCVKKLDLTSEMAEQIVAEREAEDPDRQPGVSPITVDYSDLTEPAVAAVVAPEPDPESYDDPIMPQSDYAEEVNI